MVILMCICTNKIIKNNVLPFSTKINENKNQSTESIEAFLIKPKIASRFPYPKIINYRFEIYVLPASSFDIMVLFRLLRMLTKYHLQSLRLM